MTAHESASPVEVRLGYFAKYDNRISVYKVQHVYPSPIPWIVTLAFPARLGMATDSPPANV